MIKFKLKHIVSAVSLACTSFGAHATDYVFSDCALGAAVGCVAGADGAAGTISAPWQTLAKVVTTMGTAVAGDRILFCKGAAWNNWSINTIPTTSTYAAYKANPIIFDQVACNTFTSSAKYVLNTRTKKLDNVTDCDVNDAPNVCNAFEFTQISGSPVTRGGVIIRNADIRGADAPGTSSLRVRGVISSVSLEDSIVSHVEWGGGCQSNGTYNPTENINFRRNNISNVARMGITYFNGCSKWDISYNVMDQVAIASMILNNKLRDHPIYASGCDWGGNTCVSIGNTIMGNTITRSCTGATDIGDATKSACAMIVGHDRLAYMKIAYNYLYTASGKSYGTNYGIQYSPGNGGGEVEGQDYLTIDSNMIVNYGNSGIEIAACRFCAVTNNILVQETVTDSAEAIHMIESPYVGSGARQNSQNRFVNNSVYIAQGNDNTKVFSVRGSGTGHVVAGNLVTIGPGGPGGFLNCYDSDLPAASFTTWNNNLCNNANNWFTGYATKAAFTAARSGADSAGVSADPLLLAVPSLSTGFSMQIQSGSPAKNAGLAVRADNRLTYGGGTRIAPIDIGACEQGVNVNGCN